MTVNAEVAVTQSETSPLFSFARLSQDRVSLSDIPNAPQSVRDSGGPSPPEKSANGGHESQFWKNKIEPKAHIKSIFAYSPNQNIAYIIPEYSV